MAVVQLSANPSAVYDTFRSPFALVGTKWAKLYHYTIGNLFMETSHELILLIV